MKVMMTFQQCLVVTLLVTARTSTLNLDSVKFSSFNSTLELKWENGETDSAVLVHKGDCIYDGHLTRDAVSSILVTGCKDAFIDVQIQSEPYGDHLFSLNNGLVAYVVMEEHDYDLYPDYLEIDEFPVAAQGNGRLKRALDDYYYYDEAEENPEFEKDYVDISESELSDLPIPANFILNLNVYLDQNWVIKFGSYANATRIAKQIMEQVKRLYTDNSLETKFDIQHGGRFYRSSAPHLVAKKSGLRVLNSHIKSPYTIGKDEKVAHVHLTTELGRKNKYLGRATISGLCKEGNNMAIAAYHRAGVVRTAMTVAHEIGHLLGMHHDFKTVPTQRNTCAKNGDGLVIMNYGNNRIQWSNCSNQDFKTFYQRIIASNKTFCLTSPNLGCACSGFKDTLGYGDNCKGPLPGCYVHEDAVCAEMKNYYGKWISETPCSPPKPKCACNGQRDGLGYGGNCDSPVPWCYVDENADCDDYKEFYGKWVSETPCTNNTPKQQTTTTTITTIRTTRRTTTRQTTKRTTPRPTTRRSSTRRSTRRTTTQPTTRRTIARRTTRRTTTRKTPTQYGSSPCEYTCEASGSCTSKYIGKPRAGRSSGSCLPKSFGGRCFSIPSECKDCNRELNCPE